MAPEYEIHVKIEASNREEAISLAEKMAADFDNVSVLKPHRRLTRTERPLYINQKEKILDYLCDFDGDILNLDDMKSDIEANNIKISLIRIKTILEDIKKDGYKVLPYEKPSRSKR